MAKTSVNNVGNEFRSSERRSNTGTDEGDEQTPTDEGNREGEEASD